jgi:uncharacterized protein (TIGR02145 family)
MKNQGKITRLLLAAVLILVSTSCVKDFLEYFNGNKGGSGIKDVDGNLYTSVKIGEQTWMVQNLKTTRLNDGTPIPYFSPTATDKTPAYCWYNDDINNKNPYGALYNYFAIATGKLAPKGWHVPDMDEMDYMFNTTGDIPSIVEKGTEHWINNRPEATNQSGFTALPGGWRTSSFQNLGLKAYFWMFYYAPDNGINAVVFFPNVPNNPQPYFADNIYIGGANCLSVRCLKDDVPIVSTSPVSNIASTSARSGIRRLTTGGFPVLTYGICWSTSANPNILKSQKIFGKDAIGPAEVVFDLTGLQPNTTYYMRAFATNLMGTGYGNQVIFKTTN